ncbi:MAG TPA: PQQ-binding-like beta-propeller repeat protein [Candidatus Acidoferrales bacterium]|nr:PQQ-binding-like beta-propeller repeat protein [Candidatus Acidoferrales bacterium]
MKLQCPCGAKYAFDLLPEMVQNPVRFVCPTCGLDSSEFVNEMVRREFGVPAAEPPPQPVAPPPPPPAAAPGSRLRISHHEKPAEAAPAEPVSKYCQKHRGVLATEECAICHKPICPQCMESFGYFCSPFCKNKADLQGIDVPVYAGQKFQVERQFWRKAGSIFGAALALLALLLGVWVWYAWFGSVPHPYYAVRFADDDRAYAGKTQLVGKDQLVFLHGGTLARYDLKAKKQVWSLELITKEQIAAVVKAENEASARASEGGGYSRRQLPEEIELEAKIGLQEALRLRVAGQNIWVGQADKLTHYDWDTGKVVKEITLPEFGDFLTETGDELQMIGAQSVTHVSLATGESREEQFHEPGAKPLATAGGNGNAATGGLFSGGDKPLDPNKVAQQAQNLKLPARTALPALIANAQHEQQLEAALRDDPQHPRPKNSAGSLVGRESFQLVSGKTGFVQFSQTLLEEKIVERTAMKAPPKKSALDGDVNAAHTGEIANEMLNEMQRNSGGDTVQEDESRYQVIVHLPDAPDAPDWTGEVTGPPHLFVLKTVNVIAAGKSVIVLDKTNKKLWQTSLTYAVSGGGGGFFGEESQYGEGPCVEHGDTLYVFDQAVLSAFELNSGNARWRIPSVGVVGLFFDPQGFIYVNTTSGSPDDIKFSRQIDITKSTDDILVKLDPKTGKTLWNIKPGGFISYLSGKFIYTIQSYDPNPDDAEQMSDMTLQKPAYLRIARVNPANGRIMWEHYQDRCPINVQFNENSIELVFKREVQVLRFLSF